ncbi:acetyl-coenzyme A transporter 1-domain-containing protein [Mycena alexandri]|uniref:Acetyl-coenzyme A transporter 1-domain-containing protein n=1 Tax=Mycena alexandri TaxID=1745969 RepID=A0AAD6SSK7_9AGAR|nr:acetyl-coenzyme A transporter 1-domain-containing protein [Mycena alexandri]
MDPVLGDGLSVSSTSFQNSALSPRTPRFSPRTPRSAVYTKFVAGLDGLGEEDELALLDEDDRRQYAEGLEVDDGFGTINRNKPVSSEDKRAMVLLCVLYLIQGVPPSSFIGSMPFILQKHLSYSQLATFALSGYPYSLKLAAIQWSPVVDSVFFSSFGRRKSWIIPMQIINGTLMLYISLNIQRLMDDPSHHVTHLTNVFTALVFFSATQDIAVDGWVLTLLSPENLSYASTCQTIGLNTGYFTSYTVFLALNSEAISEKWGVPRLTLAAYLRFWCFVSYSVSVWLLFKKERKEPISDSGLSVKEVYKQIWTVCKMRHIQSLAIMFVFGKIGFAANDAATSLKMVEKGLLREDLAVAVLINFPFQIIAGWLVGTWSRGEYPLRPWLLTFWPRIGFAFTAMLIVYWFPTPVSAGFFVFLVVHTVLTSFTSTIQFVGSSAFFTRISDPLIGGTYMTLLNTFSNIGTMWPKWFVLKSVDMFTVATCQIVDDSTYFGEVATECVSQTGKKLCAELEGQCLVIRDGYYLVSTFCMIFGVLFLIFYTAPTARRLQSLPATSWRVKL